MNFKFSGVISHKWNKKSERLEEKVFIVFKQLQKTIREARFNLPIHMNCVNTC